MTSTYNDTVLETYNSSADFVVTESEGAGTRYMGFNMNEFPGSSKAFRKSVSCLFDKETFLASDATFSHASSENQFVAHSEWRTNVTNGALFDCMGMTQDERRAYATGKLQEEGWSVDGSWTDFPLINLTGPNNESLPLNDSAWKILAPHRPPGSPFKFFFFYGELLAGAAEQIAQDLTDFGIPINASLVHPKLVFKAIKIPTDACPAYGATSVNYFMYILFYQTNVAVQTHLPAYFDSSNDICVNMNGDNLVHFSNSTFDDLDVQFKAANTLEDTIVFAKDQQEILQEELPYMNLFNIKHTDVFRDVVLPFELNNVMLDGYSSFGGIPELLKPVN